MPAVTVRSFGGTGQGVQVSVTVVAAGTTLGALLSGLAGGRESGEAFAGRAVLLNGESLTRQAWGGACLQDGDVIAIIPMLVGG